MSIARCFLCSLLLLITTCGAFSQEVSNQSNDCLKQVVLPVPTERNIFTEEQETHLGDAIAEHILRNHKIIEDPQLKAYLTRIGDQLSTHLPLTRMRFRYFLVDLPDANAFALPGGRIYVSRKLVAIAGTEDELASVMAHELGHLVSRDSAIDITQRLKEVLGVTQVTDRRDIYSKYNLLIDNLNRKPGVFKPRDHDKEQLLADQIGFYALVRAGYDPAAHARIWDRATDAKSIKRSFFSELFGSQRPEQRRLSEMLKALSKLSASCRQAIIARGDDFKRWQAAVIAYSPTSGESLDGIVSKRQLNPPLRGDIDHLRFSPNGLFVLAQDDSGITVLSRDPFTPLFHIETPDQAYRADFTPDSRNVVFHTQNLRVEVWGVQEKKRTNIHEIVLNKGCLQTKLSRDAKLVACLNPDMNLSLINVATGTPVWQKKDFYERGSHDYLGDLAAALIAHVGSSDLNLALVNMDFSQDGRYFAAGHRGYDQVAVAIDLTTNAPVTLPDSIKKLIASGFKFMPDHRLIGVNSSNTNKSPIVSFPAGQVLDEVALPALGYPFSVPTRGDYLFIHGMPKYPLQVFDIKAKKIIKVNEREALDIYDSMFLAEVLNGQVGLYKMEKNEFLAAAPLPNQGLGALRVAEVSQNMKYLALSGRSRGGVWNLANGEAALYLRDFQGAFLSDDGYFFGDFPKFAEAERNIARFNLANGDITQGPKIDSHSARQFGSYLLVTKPAPGNEPRYGDDRFTDRSTGKLFHVHYRNNVIIEMQDARTMKTLWSNTYPKEAPHVLVASDHQSVVLVWSVMDEFARSEIKSHPRLSEQLSGRKDKEGDYFLTVLDANSGKERAKLVIETGKGSFRLSNAFATGDWLVVSDTQNRVLIYSLSSGSLIGRVFGARAAVSASLGLLSVENERGKLTIYELATLNPVKNLAFATGIAMQRFSPDGGRLFVLTSNQTAYVLDVSAGVKAASSN